MRVLWWFATVVAVGLVSIVLSEGGALDPVENLSLTINAPVEGGIRDIASPIDEFYDGVVDRGDLVRENERLRAELEALKAQVAEHQDLEQRIAELESALEVKQSRPEDQLLVGNVIAQEPSSLKRAIAIDRGLSDGIDEGMVVLSRSGALIGTVSHAYDDFAWVRLITDPDSAVNAQVNARSAQPQPAASPQVLTEGTPAPGSPTPAPSVSATPAATSGEAVRAVAEGDLRQGLLLDLVPPEAEIADGSLVVTSGLGGNFPPGIPIGSITSVEQRPQSPFKRATLEPAADLSGLDTVLVLISFKPARLNGP